MLTSLAVCNLQSQRRGGRKVHRIFNSVCFDREGNKPPRSRERRGRYGQPEHVLNLLGLLLFPRSITACLRSGMLDFSHNIAAGGIEQLKIVDKLQQSPAFLEPTQSPQYRQLWPSLLPLCQQLWHPFVETVSISRPPLFICRLIQGVC